MCSTILHKKMLGRQWAGESCCYPWDKVWVRAGVVAVPAGTLMQSGLLVFLDQLFCDWL